MAAVVAIVAAATGWTYWNATNLDSDVHCLGVHDVQGNRTLWIGSDRGFPEGYLGRFGFFDGSEGLNHTYVPGELIEIMRMDTRVLPPSEQVENGVVWMYYAPGSGVWVRLPGPMLVTDTEWVVDPHHKPMAAAGYRTLVNRRIGTPTPRTEIVVLTPIDELTHACSPYIDWACECVEVDAVATCFSATPPSRVILDEPYCPDLHPAWPLQGLWSQFVVIGCTAVLAGAARRWHAPRDRLRWAVAGAAVWFPANVIADGLVLLVPLYGKPLAAVVIVCTQIGNLPLLALKRTTLDGAMLGRCIRASYGIGLVSLVCCLMGLADGRRSAVYGLFAAAAVVSGASGAIGCTGLWGVVPPAYVKDLSVGMSLGFVLTGGLLLGSVCNKMPPNNYFTYAAVLTVLLVAVGWIDNDAKPESSQSDDDAKPEAVDASQPSDDDDDVEKLLPGVHPKNVPEHNGAFAMLYGFNYLFPILLPYMATMQSSYLAITLTLNLADSGGRALSRPGVLRYEGITYGLWAIACVVGVLGTVMSMGYAVVIWIGCVAAAATVLRGMLITEMQQAVKAVGTSRDAWMLGASGQAGGVVGALAGLFIVYTAEQ